MAEIRPFRGYVYSPEKVGDLSRVMAPPYDVISPAFQDELYRRHPDNIVRLILGKTEEGDSEGENRYTRAASYLRGWIDEGVLSRNSKPAIYWYTQEYTDSDGRRVIRKGFIALSKLEELGRGKIHAHERTLSGPKADRLRLIEAVNANLSCIFSLYSEPERAVNRVLEDAVKGARPFIEAADDEGVMNSVWRVTDEGAVARVEELMSGKALFIADGHHRYETALNYRNLMRERSGENPTGAEPYDYVMMYFSNMEDEGITIWPTHRIVHGIKGFDPDSFLRECGQYFNITELDPGAKGAREAFVKKIQAEGRSTTAFGALIAGKRPYYLFTLRSPDTMDRVFGQSIPEDFKSLDVTVLHSLVLSRVLGITEEAQAKQENLLYVKSFDEAFSTLGDGRNQLVFILNPTKIEQVKAVSEAGHVMPQKSTYFYPKLLSGLVINLLDEPVPAAPARVP